MNVREMSMGILNIFKEFNPLWHNGRWMETGNVMACLNSHFFS